MASFSSTYPSQRPVFTLDAANAGRLDPRCSFSRASTGTFFGTDKHLSSDNILLQSGTFNTTWSNNSVAIASGQTDPAGGTNGFTLTENSLDTYHRVYQGITASGDFAFTVYAKQNSGTRYLTLTIKNANNDWVSATYDLAGGSPATGSGSSSNFSNLSATQTASGNSYYKCVLKATGSVSSDFAYLYMSDDATAAVGTYGLKTYQGDGSSSIDVAFASLSTVGATDYNATTTQIHREYAPTLQTAASGAARFEHSATDGQSEGILIEGQSTNLVTYSETLATGWTEGRSTLTAASGIAPDGTLTSNLFTVDGTAANSHNAYFEYASGGATPQTFSIFAKKGSANYIALRYGPTHGTFSDGYVFFDLSNGTKGTVTAAISESSIVDCGNGWYRCSITNTALQSGTARAIIYVAKEDNTFSFDGNSYDHIQVWGAQIEANQSFSSSYLKSNSGSTTTRAADSLSVATADIPGFSEGVGTIVCETGGVASATETNQLAFGLNGPASSNLFSAGVNNGGVTDSTVRVYSQTPDGDQAFLNPGTATVGTGYKLACRYELDNIAASMNGGTVVSDTSGKVPVGIDTLWVGELEGNYHINSNIKRIAIYGEALSDTNLISLTS